MIKCFKIDLKISMSVAPMETTALEMLLLMLLQHCC
jgi:hypothetical protein